MSIIHEHVTLVNMLSKLILGLSLTGAEWVLYLLILLSVYSLALIFERWIFFGKASKGLTEFRDKIRSAILNGKRDEALSLAKVRLEEFKNASDMETGLVLSLLHANVTPSVEIFNELANDSIVRARIRWEKNLSVLATIGSNAPFIGLFGTVLGIIQAFHDLSNQAASGVQSVTGGISEALVATAVGILVAIPAVVAYNSFSKKVKTAVQQADALKSFLIAYLSKQG